MSNPRYYLLLMVLYLTIVAGVFALRQLRQNLEAKIQNMAGPLESERLTVQSYCDRTKALASRLADEKELITLIPQDINWILRIDGHTDRVPIKSTDFASICKLSTARAVSVVRFFAALK